ncbi:DUF5919 domain-containing protein [Amycolatopsis sp. NPDC059020]|uniref:DUF5919 domain-containing protein n=1 Tax=Amycolatopsis sp. NPDC059020 TaxID=3346703 RepID=UPI0036700C5F
MIFEFITATVGIAAFLAHFFVSISEESLVELTLGILALLAVTSLLQRVTKMADVERKVDEVDAMLTNLSLEIKGIATFFRGREFTNKMTAAVGDTSSLLRRFRHTGIEGGYDSLRVSDLVPNMRKAYSIRVLSNWVGGLNELGDTLVKAAANDCDIRILILRHDSQHARSRSLELSRGADESFVQNQIATEILQFDHLFRNHPEARHKIQVKAYDASPTLCLFGYDKVRLIGLFWRGELVMNTPFLKVHGEMASSTNGFAHPNEIRTSITERIDEHFESLWSDPSAKYIRVANGKPEYVDSFSEAWSPTQRSVG